MITKSKMPRLEDFPGFVVRKGPTLSSFNPFEDELLTQGKATTFGEVRNQEGEEESSSKSKKQFLAENILDAPKPKASLEPEVSAKEALDTIDRNIQTESFVSLFPQSKPQPTESIEFDAELRRHITIALVQPRDKEGNRLLYKHPKIPTVGDDHENPFFLLVGQADLSKTAYLIQFDGGANPNPGPASSGAVLWSPLGIDGKRTVLFERGKYLGKATNNIAEVQGLLMGLQIAAMRGARELLIEGDSELIVYQQTGKYKVTNPNLKRWWAEIQAAMMDETSFDWIAIRQVRREYNQRADSITKEVLDRKEGFTRA
jgi:ribonuclease HI